MTEHEDSTAYLAMIDTAERYQNEARAARRRYRTTEATVLTLAISVALLSLVILVLANQPQITRWISGAAAVAVSLAAAYVNLWQLRRSERADTAAISRVSDYLGRYLRESGAVRSVEQELGPAWSAELRARLLGIDIGDTSVLSQEDRSSGPIGLDAFYGSAVTMREVLRDLRETQAVRRIGVIVQGTSLADELAEDLLFASGHDVKLDFLVSRQLYLDNPSVMQYLASRENQANVRLRMTDERPPGLYLIWGERAVSGIMLVPSAEGSSAAGLVLDGRLSPGVSKLTKSLAEYFDEYFMRAETIPLKS